MHPVEAWYLIRLCFAGLNLDSCFGSPCLQHDFCLCACDVMHCVLKGIDHASPCAPMKKMPTGASKRIQNGEILVRLWQVSVPYMFFLNLQGETHNIMGLTHHVDHFPNGVFPVSTWRFAKMVIPQNHGCQY
jgi:hypothetical protein